MNEVIDKLGNIIEKGDVVKCGKVEFVVEEFKFMKNGDTLICGDWGCFNLDFILLVKKV